MTSWCHAGGFQEWIENMTDQSHVSWAHHTAAGNRCATRLVCGSVPTVLSLVVQKKLACQQGAPSDNVQIVPL